MMIRGLKPKTKTEAAYERDIERLEDAARASRMGYALPRPDLPAADQEQKDLPDCELSEIELARIHAREARVILQDGTKARLKIMGTDRTVTAYSENKLHRGDIVYITIEMSHTFSERITILGKKKEGD